MAHCPHQPPPAPPRPPTPPNLAQQLAELARFYSAVTATRPALCPIAAQAAYGAMMEQLLLGSPCVAIERGGAACRCTSAAVPGAAAAFLAAERAP